MRHLQITFLVVAAHTAIACVCLVAAFIKKSPVMKYSSIVMLLTPPVGVFYFWGCEAVFWLLKKNTNLQLEDISFSKARHNRVDRPDVERELQVIPLE